MEHIAMSIGQQRWRISANPRKLPLAATGLTYLLSRGPDCAVL